MKEIEQILALEISDSEKLARAFDWITGRVVEDSRREVELLRVLGDQQALVKEQVKLSTIQHARTIFNQCYRMVSGKAAWDE